MLKIIISLKKIRLCVLGIIVVLCLFYGCQLKSDKKMFYGYGFELKMPKDYYVEKQFFIEDPTYCIRKDSSRCEISIFASNNVNLDGFNIVDKKMLTNEYKLVYEVARENGYGDSVVDYVLATNMNYPWLKYMHIFYFKDNEDVIRDILKSIQPNKIEK